MVLTVGGISVWLIGKNPIAVLIAVGIAVILMLAIILFLQFFDVGIVLSGYGVIETFSALFVRRPIFEHSSIRLLSHSLLLYFQSS